MTVIPIFDTHAHLDLEPFHADFDVLMKRLEAGRFPDAFTPGAFDDKHLKIEGILVPGIDAASSVAAVKLAEKHPLLHAAVAVHPNYSAKAAADDWNTIQELARSEHVVAIGETGLDKYWDYSPLELQIEFLKRHFELSRETGKPILIHCRDAWTEMLAILRETSGVRGVIHAFSGDPEFAEESVKLGYYVSFAGSVTYRNAKFEPLWEAARRVPADRLLIETDAPYMTPHPYRGKLERNDPSMTALVAMRLAELRGETLEFIANTTTENAKRLFFALRG